MSITWKRRTVAAICAICGTAFEASAYKIKQGKGQCCSIRCANAQRVASRKADRSNYQRLDSQSRFKEQMREQVGRRCQRCQKTEAENGRKLDVHRKTASIQGGAYTSENIEVLCQTCHVTRERWATN